MRILFSIVFLLVTSLGLYAQPPKTPQQVAEENKRIEAENLAIKTLFETGNQAYVNKDFDAAIAAFDKGINAYPDHPGVTSLYSNKAFTLIVRGIKTYNSAFSMTSETAKTASIQSAKTDWTNASLAGKKAIELAKRTPEATGPIISALRAYSESMRWVATKVDPANASGAISAYNDYQASETDPAHKSQARRDFARMLFDLGDTEKAAAEYEKILTTSPNDLDALFFGGTSLAAFLDKPSQQKGANYLKRFLTLAPSTDNRRKDAGDALDYLRSEGVVAK